MSENTGDEPSKKPCKKCKEEIDVTAKKCPHCQTKNPHVSGAAGCFTFLAICAVIYVVSALFTGPDETPKVNTSGKKAAQGSSSQKPTGVDDPDFIPFEYIDVKEKRDIKMSADVLVELQDGELPTEDNLKATGAHVVSYHEAKNNFVSFFLPGMSLNSTAYAVYTHRKGEKPSLAVYDFMVPQKYKEKEKTQ